jgi:predicted aconitase
MIALDKIRIELGKEEQDILQGRQGATLQKVMETVVRYGEALGAQKLVDIEGDGHFVIAYAIPGIAPSIEMLDELVADRLKTKFPFTLDPKPPLDFENWWLSADQVECLKQMYRDQERYDEQMLRLGLRDSDAWTCTPYLPQVGNIPQRDAILAWSESACAIYANSVLGARTNKNGAIIDLLCGIVGKTPLAGLLTDEGRQASWLIEVRTEELPAPQVLGAAIGQKVLADVPFIVGLDHFLGPGLNARTRDYLHEMGAACATAGAVALFHVEHITPEALDHGRGLLIPNYKTHAIDDQQLQDLLASYPVLWEDESARPEKCFIGCPHLSLEQLYWWTEEIGHALQVRSGSVLAVPTTLCAAPQVLQEFKSDTRARQQLENAGARLSIGCPMQLFDDDLSAGEAILTNSNKLRAYTPARFFPDEELVEILVRGEIGGERKSEQLHRVD